MNRSGVLGGGRFMAGGKGVAGRMLDVFGRWLNSCCIDSLLMIGLGLSSELAGDLLWMNSPISDLEEVNQKTPTIVDTYEGGLEENCKADTLLERLRRSFEFSLDTKLTCFRSVCCSLVAASSFLNEIRWTSLWKVSVPIFLSFESKLSLQMFCVLFELRLSPSWNLN